MIYSIEQCWHLSGEELSQFDLSFNLIGTRVDCPARSSVRSWLGGREGTRHCPAFLIKAAIAEESARATSKGMRRTLKYSERTHTLVPSLCVVLYIVDTVCVCVFTFLHLVRSFDRLWELNCLEVSHFRASLSLPLVPLAKGGSSSQMQSANCEWIAWSWRQLPRLLMTSERITPLYHSLAFSSASLISVSSSPPSRDSCSNILIWVPGKCLGLVFLIV